MIIWIGLGVMSYLDGDITYNDWIKECKREKKTRKEVLLIEVGLFWNFIIGKTWNKLKSSDFGKAISEWLNEEVT